MEARINLDKASAAEQRLDEFAKTIQSGVTVYSPKGLLFSLLLDMDYEVID